MKLNSHRQACSIIATRLDEIAPYYDQDVIVTYIPTSTKRVRERGFDHAKLIAQHFSATRGLKCKNLLLRTTQQKQAGTDRKTRLQQVKGSYQASKPSLNIDQVVLIDDIITTGATLSEATRVLKKSGIKTIESLVFAQPIR
jgi:competence protein ComFC